MGVTIDFLKRSLPLLATFVGCSREGAGGSRPVSICDSVRSSSQASPIRLESLTLHEVPTRYRKPDWINKGERFSLKQTGTSVAFRYETPGVDHEGSGLYEKDGRQIILNLTRELKSNGCKLNGRSKIEVVTCGELKSETTWDAGCDLPQGWSDLAKSSRAP